MTSGNPTLSEKAFRSTQAYVDAQGRVMSIQGTATKAIFLLLVVIATATATWSMALRNPQAFMGWLIGGSVGGLVLAIVTVVKKDWAGITGPLYAAAEGIVLGGLSSLMELAYPGIVPQAVGLTFGTFVVMLVLYKTRLIAATPAFVRGVMAATGGVCLVYVASMVMNLFGVRIPYIHEGGAIGIGVSVVIVVIAALNLILDFAVIEQGAKAGAPKVLEWYAAFALTVTLVWLYLEILRLLGKARER